MSKSTLRIYHGVEASKWAAVGLQSPAKLFSLERTRFNTSERYISGPVFTSVTDSIPCLLDSTVSLISDPEFYSTLADSILHGTELKQPQDTDAHLAGHRLGITGIRHQRRSIALCAYELVNLYRPHFASQSVYITHFWLLLAFLTVSRFYIGQVSWVADLCFDPVLDFSDRAKSEQDSTMAVANRTSIISRSPRVNRLLAVVC